MNLKEKNLRQMLSPQSIAFVGSKKYVEQGIKNCRNLGYQGKIFAVNRSEKEIAGMICYQNIADLPQKIDAVFLAIHREKTIEAVRELAQLGTAGCVCYAAGFAEIGNDHLQTELINAAQDMALVGPNCYGVLNYLDRLSLWPDRHGGQTVDKGVAIISQSGNISLNLTMNDRSLPLAYVFSVGNQAVLEIADYISVLCEDPRVTAIGLHIEGLNDLDAFSRAAEKALEKGVPLVALKTGTSEMGSKLTMSHTSSLAGSDELYQALFDRLNICRVDSLTALIETLKLFSITRSIKGRNLGVLTCSGGESTIVADFAATYGFVLPSLNENVKETLENQLTEFEHVSNPLDYNTSIWGKEKEIERCFTTFMKDNFDLILLILDLLDQDNGDIQPWEASINALISASHTNQSPLVVISTLAEGLPSNIRKKLIQNGITPMQGISEAFRAIFAVQQYYIKKEQRRKVKIKLLAGSHLSESSAYSLTEWEGKQLLRAYGLQVPKGILVSKEEEIVIRGMDGPFVVKGVSKQLAHKTEFGAVILNVQNKPEVMQAIEQISKNLAHIPEEEQLFLIEEMVHEAVAELNIGLIRDAQFGLALVISMGGELVNLLNDSVPLLLPTTKDEIKEAIYSLKGIKLLEGFRGRPLGDLEAVVTAAEAVALFAEDHLDSLLELDINPLLVLPKGKGVRAVDALIRKIAVEDLQIVL